MKHPLLQKAGIYTVFGLSMALIAVLLVPAAVLGALAAGIWFGADKLLALLEPPDRSDEKEGW